jgi:hypothetical protein
MVIRTCHPPPPVDALAALEQSEKFWVAWSKKCRCRR